MIIMPQNKLNKINLILDILAGKVTAHAQVLPVHTKIMHTCSAVARTHKAGPRTDPNFGQERLLDHFSPVRCKRKFI